MRAKDTEEEHRETSLCVPSVACADLEDNYPGQEANNPRQLKGKSSLVNGATHKDGDEGLLLAAGYNRLWKKPRPGGATGMATVRVFVGLDYHDAGVQVCILDPQGRVLANAPYPNDAAALAEFVAQHGNQVFAAIEACTGAADLADEMV